MESSIYIYGLIQTRTPQNFGELGIDNQTYFDVFTLGHKDIAAVVSKRPPIPYDAMKKEDIIKNLVFHQYVIEQVMKRFTVLPVKFGTQIETEDAIREFLEDGYTLISNEISKAEGKIELDVVAWWELPKILPSLSFYNDQIREMQQKIATKGAQVDVKDKITLGHAVEQALQREKARYQQFLLRLLKQEAIDVCMHDLANDEMVFNAAFLLEKDNEERFYATVQKGDQLLKSLLNFRVVGPLPPYSFSTILFKRLDPAKIEEAKKVLGLTGEITAQTLHETYYQRAKHYHPDTKEGETTMEFQRLRDAHEMLKNFIDHGWIFTEVCRWT